MEGETITGELCMFCHNKTLTLNESAVDVPYFGLAHLFSMNCSSCGYRKSDVEFEKSEPAKYTLETSSEEDMKIRIIRSSEATVKIPYVGTLEPGEEANGFISNVEGVLDMFVKIIEGMKEESDDNAGKKKAKNLLKKIQKAKWGQEKLKIIVEDPSGNSAIISDKAEKSKL